MLTPTQILERLSQRLDLLKGGRDADPRQQTLRATIEWSHALLSPEEERLFARLAVFAGGCTLSAAEQVAEAELDTLQSLVDKSLLRHGDDRFWMLETIREFAAERLEASGEGDELQRRHADFFLALAEEAAPHVEREWAMGIHDWMDRLQRDLDNLRAALDHLETDGPAESWLRMAGALSDFWSARGYALEGLDRIRRALEANPDPTLPRARGLLGAANLASLNGEDDRSRNWAQEALALHRTLGDARGVAQSLFDLGAEAVQDGDWELATSLLTESLTRFQELGYQYWVPWITRTLAWSAAQSGDLARARDLYEQGLGAAREIGSRAAEAALLGALGWLAILEGHPRDALPLYVRSLTLKREIDDLEEIAVGLTGSSRAIALAGDGITAARVLSCAATIREELGTAGESWVARDKADALDAIQAELDEAAFTQAWEEGARLSPDEAIGLALESLARSGAEPAR